MLYFEWHLVVVVIEGKHCCRLGLHGQLVNHKHCLSLRSPIAKSAILSGKGSPFFSLALTDLDMSVKKNIK